MQVKIRVMEKLKLAATINHKVVWLSTKVMTTKVTLKLMGGEIPLQIYAKEET
jgi:hypothetical protein